jgi:hypothetical protein
VIAFEFVGDVQTMSLSESSDEWSASLMTRKLPATNPAASFPATTVALHLFSPLANLDHQRLPLVAFEHR